VVCEKKLLPLKYGHETHTDYFSDNTFENCITWPRVFAPKLCENFPDYSFR